MRVRPPARTRADGLGGARASQVDYITLEQPEKLSVPGYDRKVDFGLFWEWAYKVPPPCPRRCRRCAAGVCACVDQGCVSEHVCSLSSAPPSLPQLLCSPLQVEDSDEEIVIATTRPETMFGDSAVAVHPEDERYKKFHGKFLTHPITGRRMPIIQDAELVEMDFGTGAVKITPAHDPNDFVTGNKHGLEFINILNDDGTLNAACGDKYAGMHRFKARFEIVKDLTERGLFKGSRPNPGMRLGVSSRTKDVIEPVLKPQWWVDSKNMADEALAAADDGRLTILPAIHKRKWHDWLGNPPPPRTNRTRRVPHPVLIGHAASLTPYRQHPRLVHLPPAMVGAPHPRLLRAFRG